MPVTNARTSQSIPESGSNTPENDPSLYGQVCFLYIIIVLTCVFPAAIFLWSSSEPHDRNSTILAQMSYTCYFINPFAFAGDNPEIKSLWMWTAVIIVIVCWMVLTVGNCLTVYRQENRELRGGIGLFVDTWYFCMIIALILSKSKERPRPQELSPDEEENRNCCWDPRKSKMSFAIRLRFADFLYLTISSAIVAASINDNFDSTIQPILLIFGSALYNSDKIKAKNFRRLVQSIVTTLAIGLFVVGQMLGQENKTLRHLLNIMAQLCFNVFVFTHIIVEGSKMETLFGNFSEQIKQCMKAGAEEKGYSYQELKGDEEETQQLRGDGKGVARLQIELPVENAKKISCAVGDPITNRDY